MKINKIICDKCGLEEKLQAPTIQPYTLAWQKKRKSEQVCPKCNEEHDPECNPEYLNKPQWGHNE